MFEALGHHVHKNNIMFMNRNIMFESLGHHVLENNIMFMNRNITFTPW